MQLNNLKVFERLGDLSPNNSASGGSLLYVQYPMPRPDKSSREAKQALALNGEFLGVKKQLISYLI